MKSVLHTTPAVDPAYMIHYIFFIGYFASMDFVDKNNPRDAGIYFVVILSLGFGIAGLNLFRFFGFLFDYSIAIMLVAGIVASINYSFYTERRVNKLKSKFDFIGQPEFRKKRKRTAMVLFLIFFISTVATALLNNEEIKQILLN